MAQATALPLLVPTKFRRPNHHRKTLTPPPTTWRTTTTTNQRDLYLSPTSPNSNTTTTHHLLPSDVLRLMDCLRLPVEADLYASLLEECAATMDPSQGSLVHDHLRRGGGRNLRGRDALLVANRLLLMYCQCALPGCARKVFDRMPARDLVTWVVMVAGYTHSGDHEDALKLFVEMLETGLDDEDGCCCFLHHPAGAICVASVLRSCTKSAKLALGRCVHGLVVKGGVLGNDGYYGRGEWWRLGKLLVKFYGEVGCMDYARRVFERWRLRDSAACTAMMAVYNRHHMFWEALQVFIGKGRSGKWKRSLLSGALRACGRMDDGEEWTAMQLHAITVKVGGANLDWFVGLQLVEMYGRLKLTREARKVFDEIGGEKDYMCWSTMFETYARWGCCKEAIKLLYEMKAAGLQPEETMLEEARLVCGSR